MALVAVLLVRTAFLVVGYELRSLPVWACLSLVEVLVGLPVVIIRNERP
jgi:hypothetical protein